MGSSKIVIVCGPTASGKSARAIDIAQAQGGVIINADAMQVYQELRILSARPSVKEEAEAPHKLYGVLPASEPCSAAKWLALAETVIDEVLAAKKLPIVIGGTGLYIKALMEGLSLIPPVPEEWRKEATRLYDVEGEAALLARDPAMAKRLKAGDRQRHIRALAVRLATRKSLSYWQAKSRVKPYPHATFEIEYLNVSREALYRRCDARFLSMMEAGALEEARSLQALGLSNELPAMRAVGVPELIGHLEGKWSLDEAIKRAQQATRNYAKRQVTWFKHQLHKRN